MNTILIARITKLLKPRFSKTLFLVKSRFKKYRPRFRHNEIKTTQNSGKIFQDYPKPRFIFFMISANMPWILRLKITLTL